MRVNTLRRVIREEAVRTLAKKKATTTIREQKIRSLIKETYQELCAEATANSPQICEALEELRMAFVPEMLRTVNENGAGLHLALEKRIQLKTVSELINVPVNELMLYFINEVKTTNERQLISYHLGHVYFRAN